LASRAEMMSLKNSVRDILMNAGESSDRSRHDEMLGIGFDRRLGPPHPQHLPRIVPDTFPVEAALRAAKLHQAPDDLPEVFLLGSLWHR